MTILNTILHYFLAGLGVMFIFCLAIVIHEFGHFLAARLLGFQVDAFSIFFGPAIWKKKVDGVEYRIGCIPLGGYVALPQLDPSSMDSIQGKHSNSGEKKEEGAGAEEPKMPPPPVEPWKRVVVAVAGPFGNVVLAVILAFVIGFAAPDNEFGGYGTVVGQVEEAGLAAKSGLMVGDRIVKVGDQDVSFWTEVILECHLCGSTNNGIPVVVRRAPAAVTEFAEGTRVATDVELTLPLVRDDFTGYLRIPGVAPLRKCSVAEIFPGSPAEEAGLKKGDEIRAIGGVAPNGPTDAVRLIGAAGANPIQLLVWRKGSVKEFAATVTARYNGQYDRLMIGASFTDPSAGVPQWMMYKRPWQQLSGDAKGIFRIFRALFAPQHKGESGRAAKDMGGPGTLLFILWMEVQAGLFHALAFLRFLCVNLAIINLLPLPVLDGGHVLFAVIEMITRKRPSPKIVDWVTNTFAFLLIGLMALLLFRDAVRIHKYTRGPAAVETKAK